MFDATQPITPDPQQSNNQVPPTFVAPVMPGPMAPPMPNVPVPVVASSPAPQTGAPSAPKPASEVQDILADVDKATTVNNQHTTTNTQSTSSFQSPVPSQMENLVVGRESSVGSQIGKPSGFANLWQTKKWLVIGGVVIILAVIAAGVAAYLGSFSGGEITLPPEQTQNQPLDQGVSQQPSTTPEVQPLSTPETGLPGDDDRDGLTNEEEQKAGTNPEVADTDQDGLSDYEEIKVYSTNPLSADTDGDGYKDGAEIQNGYNPKGGGKLLDLDAALKAQYQNQGSVPAQNPTPQAPAPSQGLPINTGE